MMASKKASLVKLLTETTTTIIAHPRHFSSLSALFLLPISILATLSPFLFHTISLVSQYNQLKSTGKTETPPLPKSQLLLYTLLILIFNTCAVSSITRATITALQNRAPQFGPSLKSIPLSFFPILVTKLATLLIVVLISFATALFTVIISVAFGLFYSVDFTSTSFTTFVLALTTALLAGAMIYVNLQWCLIYPVVVLESTWGFAPLKRSAYLVTGMRSVALLMMLVFGISTPVMSMWYANFMADRAGWVVAVMMVVYAGFVTVSSLFNIVFFAVLFVHCKDLHGETVSKFDANSDVEFTKLPLDDLPLIV